MKRKHSAVQRLTAEWLDESIRHQTLLGIAGAIAALIGGIVVLIITYGVLRGILFFLGVSFGISLSYASGIAWFILALLFVAYLFADFEHLEDLQFESRGRLITARLVARGFGSPWLGLMAGPKSAHSFVKVISMLALAGPGLLATSWQLVRRAWRLQQSNREATAWVIATSLRSGAKVELASAADQHPDANWERVIPELCLIDGVVLLQGPPAAVTLTDGFRERIAEWRDRRQERVADD